MSELDELIRSARDWKSYAGVHVDGRGAFLTPERATELLGHVYVVTDGDDATVKRVVEACWAAVTGLPIEEARPRNERK